MKLVIKGLLWQLFAIFGACLMCFWLLAFSAYLQNPQHPERIGVAFVGLWSLMSVLTGRKLLWGSSK